MTLVYSQTATLALALIVVPITIFVFGVSMLGRALERARENMQTLYRRKSDEEKIALGEHKAALARATEESETSGVLGDKIGEIQRKIVTSQKAVEHYDREVEAAGSGALSLTVANCVVVPVFWFFICFALASSAAGLAGSSTFLRGWLATLVPLALWSLGLASALFGFVRFVIPSLRKIQEVAVQSDEVYQKSTIEAMTTALARHEETRRPELVIAPDSRSLTIAPLVQSNFKLFFSVLYAQGVHRGALQRVVPQSTGGVPVSWPQDLDARGESANARRAHDAPVLREDTARDNPTDRTVADRATRARSVSAWLLCSV